MGDNATLAANWLLLESLLRVTASEGTQAVIGSRKGGRMGIVLPDGSTFEGDTLAEAVDKAYRAKVCGEQ
jgi:hypothetical protein